MTAVSYWVPCRVSATVKLTEAGKARLEECVQRLVETADCATEENARHQVLMNLVDWFGAQGRRPSNTDGFADLDDSDIEVSVPEWEPAWVSEVEVTS